jgi:alpha-tubulin suppressor-like RCC1 family protein
MCHYRVLVTNRHGGVSSQLAMVTAGPILVWGNNSSEQTWIPAGVTNPVQVSAGVGHCVALNADGSLVQWGGLFGLEIPTGLGRCAAISAGAYHNVAILTDGVPVAWGSNFEGQATVPPDLTNARFALAARSVWPPWPQARRRSAINGSSTGRTSRARPTPH